MKAEIRGDVVLKYLNLTEKQTKRGINQLNRGLMKKFLEYVASKGRTDGTLAQYRADLTTFFKWNAAHNDNKDFIKITAEDFIRFREMGSEDMKWSMSRIRTVEGAVSSLSSYVQEELRDDDHYGGYRSVIRNCRLKISDIEKAKPVYTEDDLQYILDILEEDCRYKEACLLALAMYSGRTKRELLKFKPSFFVEYKEGLYKTPVRIHTDKGNESYFYILKEKFDPYLKMWMDFREENGIESEWLFPEYTDNSKPWRREAVETIFAEISKESEISLYWTSLNEFAVKEFLKAGLSHEMLWEMSGISDESLIKAYMKG